MSPYAVKTLILLVAILIGLNVGIATAWLAQVRGAHVALAIRDGGVAFAGAVTLTVLLLAHLGLL
ncbi:hypothetical protein BJY24_005732 [Nocardia transvalensis]|uniref:Uncharacterized protein n=1 Tax=Nocardia transvalensis TaxID=37333 RepID=A0A7W9PIP8_9NOCA|nr:hypothetical protein [Nocardia transvalensis]